MKKICVGLSGIVSGVILLGLTNIAVVIYTLVLFQPDGQGWNSELGLYGTALLKVGTVPIVLSVVLIIAGFMFLSQELWPRIPKAIKQFVKP